MCYYLNMAVFNYSPSLPLNHAHPPPPQRWPCSSSEKYRCLLSAGPSFFRTNSPQCLLIYQLSFYPHCPRRNQVSYHPPPPFCQRRTGCNWATTESHHFLPSREEASAWQQQLTKWKPVNTWRHLKPNLSWKFWSLHVSAEYFHIGYWWPWFRSAIIPTGTDQRWGAYSPPSGETGSIAEAFGIGQPWVFPAGGISIDFLSTSWRWRWCSSLPSHTVKIRSVQLFPAYWFPLHRRWSQCRCVHQQRDLKEPALRHLLSDLWLTSHKTGAKWTCCCALWSGKESKQGWKNREKGHSRCGALFQAAVRDFNPFPPRFQTAGYHAAVQNAAYFWAEDSCNSLWEDSS